MPPKISLTRGGMILLASTCFVHGQVPSITLPPGTPLAVQIDKHLPMRVGTPIHAELLYAVYAEGHFVLPARTPVQGTVVALTPDRSHRIQARLRLDFTPFHNPVVHFDSVTLPDGTTVPITTGSIAGGAPIFRAVAPPPRKGGIIAQGFHQLEQAAKDRLKVITAPDKGDRALQFLYSQLPVHPERIARATAWTTETSEPVSLPEIAPPAAPPTAVAQQSASRQEGTPSILLQAYLDQTLSSATSHNGDAIHATVAEPILNPDGSTQIPQGATLTGTISHARPARSFSRAGELRFDFRQLTLPGGPPQSVQAELKGADTDANQQLAMNSEGQVKPRPQDKLIVPFILLQLAARPLDRDGGRHAFGKDAVASNSLGVLGFIVGTAAGRPNIAAGIGFYGAALSIYERIFHRGKEVAFPKDTRIVVETTARRSAAMKP